MKEMNFKSGVNNCFIRSSIIFVTFFCIVISSLRAQGSECAAINTAFKAGENVSYIVSYNWFVFFTDVGLASFRVKNARMFGKPVLHLEATGVSTPSWDRFFMVRDLYQSWVDPVTVLPAYFSRSVREGRYFKDITYRFNHTTGIVYSQYESSKKKFFRDTVAIKPCTYDLVSVIYHLRNIDLKNIEPGDTIGFRIMLDNELTGIYVRYLGSEEKSIRKAGTFKTLKFSVSLVEGSVFSGGENMFIWVTDDKNRIPVSIETPIRVGQVRVRISEWEGLRHPLSSKIK
jgi:hypothetical protein